MNPTDVAYIKEVVQQMAPFETAYAAHSYFMCFFNSCLAICSLYYINITRLQSNFELKPLAIYNTLCCWIAAFYSDMNQPVALPKLGGGYSNGLVWHSGKMMTVLGFWLSWTCMAQLSLISTFGFLLQFARMEVIKNNCFIRFIQWFNSKRRIWLFLNASLVFHATLLSIPAFFRYFYSENVQNVKGLEEILAKNPSFVVAVADYNFITVYFTMIVFALTFSELIISLFANYLTLRAIRSTKSFVRKYTLRKQMTTYRLFLTQIILGCIFFYTPVFVSSLIKLTGTNQAFVMPLNISVASWYFPVQFFIQLIQVPKIKKLFDYKTPVNSIVTVT